MKKIVRALLDFLKGKEYVRFEILKWLGGLLVPRYRFMWPQLAWWDDADFNEYLDKFQEREGLNTDRRWMLGQLLRLITSVPGDTAECGVYKGAGSHLICRFIRRHPHQARRHFVFDSFEGLSTPGAGDGTHWEQGDLECRQEILEANLCEFEDLLSIHKGWIPERFPDVDQNRFALVHVDVDLFEPTLDSFEFFYPRLNDGGILVCDDYGHTTCPGATLAIDQFLRDKPEKMLAMSCGGGFLIKGRATAPADS